MKKAFLFIIGLFLVSCGSQYSVMKDGPLTVKTYPKVLVLNGFSGAVAASYILDNNSDEKMTFTARTTYFASQDGEWKSGPLWPDDQNAVLNPGDTMTFTDFMLVPFDVVYQIYNAGKLKNKELIYVQEFNYRIGELDSTVSVKWKVKLNVSFDQIVFYETNIQNFNVIAENSYYITNLTPGKMDTFLTYSDRVYSEMEKILGYRPTDGKKIKLFITEWTGFPYFTDHILNSPYVSIPAALIFDKNPWLYVVFPHELCHFFLLTEFPNPPRWMSEGPASWFAGKVCASLGYEKIAEEDYNKIAGWGEDYKNSGAKYMFTKNWPNDNPGDHPLGFGRAFELMGDIEKLCGDDIFARLFAKWHQDGFKFPADKNDLEKTAIVIDALAKLSGKDVMGLFKSYGYVPEK